MKTKTNAPQQIRRGTATATEALAKLATELRAALGETPTTYGEQFDGWHMNPTFTGIVIRSDYEPA